MRHWLATTLRAPAWISGRRESLDPLAFHQHTARRAASGEHHQVRIEPERRQVARTDLAVVAAVGRERQHRASRRALVHQCVGGEVDDPERLERTVLEVRSRWRRSKPNLRVARIAGHEPRFTTRPLQARQAHRGAGGISGIAEREETRRLIGSRWAAWDGARARRGWPRMAPRSPRTARSRTGRRADAAGPRAPGAAARRAP